MDSRQVDYDSLKKRGFLKSKEDHVFTLRTQMPAGNYSHDHLEKIAVISRRYGRGIVHLTVRQGIEIPFIPGDKINEVERELKAARIRSGTSGPRLRTTTSCPGNNWCKRGLVNTFALFDRIENELGIRCAMDLPHKFKIVISGCPNTCTRAQVSEIGLHGAIDLDHPKKRIGYAVYVGGCGGKTPRIGFKLDKVFTENEALVLIERVVGFYKNNAKPKQRLGLLIEEMGRERFLNTIGYGKKC